MKRLASLLPIILAMMAATSARAAEPLTLRNVRLASAEASPLSRITFDGDRILAIELEDGTPSAGASLDGAGAYATPGLWDMHIHALSDPDAAIGRTLPLLISHGVTGIRDMGSLPARIVETRARLAADPAPPRPRMYVSGPLLDGQALPWYGDLPLVLETVEEVPAAIQGLQAQGMDFLKVYSGLKPEVLDAIAAEADRLGLPTAGHVTLQGGLSAAARIRQGSVEHLSVATFLECLPNDPGFFDRWVRSRFEGGYDAYWELILDFDARADWPLCEARFQDLAKTETAFTPTLVMEFLDRERTDLAALAWLEPGSQEWCETNLSQVDAADSDRQRRVYSAYARMLARIRAAGIPILAGSDAPNFCLAPGSSLLRELERLVEVGLTPTQALAAATTAPAKLMGRSHDMGRLAPGYVADIVLTAANPFEDVRAYRDVRLVVAAGQVHDVAALARMRSTTRTTAAASVTPSAVLRGE